MTGLRILFTNASLAARAGTELYVRDVALAALRRGHTPIVYSTELGDVAREIRLATIPVVDDLHAIGVPPDLIHGHHHRETMTALLHFSGVPAVYACHDWYHTVDLPPRFPRIRRYLAVDETCYDRIVYERQIPEERTRLIPSFVDLERFQPRPSLPRRPARALLFSNYAEKSAELEAVRSACRRAGLTLEIAGLNLGRASARPEDLLVQYDLVFAKGRAALEALAVGAAVILYFGRHAGPIVSSADVDRLRTLNFGVRAMSPPIAPAALETALSAEIDRYDAVDAAEASRRIRATAGLDLAVDALIALYEEIIDEHRTVPAAAPEVEARAAADYLREMSVLATSADAALHRSVLYRLWQRARRMPVVGRPSVWLARKIRNRPAT